MLTDDPESDEELSVSAETESAAGAVSFCPQAARDPAASRKESAAQSSLLFIMGISHLQKSLKTSILISKGILTKARR
jgi:hypothetical protein